MPGFSAHRLFRDNSAGARERLAADGGVPIIPIDVADLGKAFAITLVWSIPGTVLGIAVLTLATPSSSEALGR